MSPFNHTISDDLSTDRRSELLASLIGHACFQRLCYASVQISESQDWAGSMTQEPASLADYKYISVKFTGEPKSD